MMLAGAFYFLKPKYGKKGICGCWAATRGARGDIALFFFNGNTTLYTILPVKNPPAIQETQVQSLGQEDPLEKGMATHSSILAWILQDLERGAQWTTPWSLFFSSWGGKESDTTKQLLGVQVTLQEVTSEK